LLAQRVGFVKVASRPPDIRYLRPGLPSRCWGCLTAEHATRRVDGQATRAEARVAAVVSASWPGSGVIPWGVVRRRCTRAVDGATHDPFVRRYPLPSPARSRSRSAISPSRRSRSRRFVIPLAASIACRSCRRHSQRQSSEWPRGSLFVAATIAALLADLVAFALPTLRPARGRTFRCTSDDLRARLHTASGALPVRCAATNRSTVDCGDRCGGRVRSCPSMV